MPAGAASVVEHDRFVFSQLSRRRARRLVRRRVRRDDCSRRNHRSSNGLLRERHRGRRRGGYFAIRGVANRAACQQPAAQTWRPRPVPGGTNFFRKPVLRRRGQRHAGGASRHRIARTVVRRSTRPAATGLSFTTQPDSSCRCAWCVSASVRIDWAHDSVFRNVVA